MRSALLGLALGFLPALALAQPGGAPRGVEAPKTLPEVAAERLREALPGAKVTVRPYGVDVQLEGDPGPQLVSFNQLAGVCHTRTPACEDALAAFLRNLIRSFQTTEPLPDPKDLRVIVRGADYLRGAAAQSETMGKRLMSPRRLVKGLLITCVLDRPGTMRFVNTEDLAAMGLSEDEAFARGAKNTAAELGPPEGRLAREQDGFQVYTGHAYASSLLLPASAWAKVAGRTKGGLLMIAPKPDLLFAMDAATPDAEGMMARVAAVAAADAPGRMSTLVYRWSSGGWQPFLRGPQSL